MDRIYGSNLFIDATPTDPNHAVRLVDLENSVGQHYKAAVRVRSVTNLPGTYAANVLTGPDTSTVLPTIDGLTLAVGDRILLTAQTDLTQNGIYEVTDLGDGSTVPYVLTRSPDFDASSDISPGVKVHVNQGTDGHDTTYVLITDGPIALNSTSLQFEVFVGRTKRVAWLTFPVTGDGSTTEFTFNHGWNTRNVLVNVIDQTTFADIYVAVSRPSDNAVKIEFAKAPSSSDSYMVILSAEVTPA
ncbi:MAG: hypothetical protein LBS60_09020 [Deltaproteobacteria bacterium]|jgi:hypothetical protein|nr:hypothetical protein [Deltaproteobacteria bacterium]